MRECHTRLNLERLGLTKQAQVTLTKDHQDMSSFFYWREEHISTRAACIVLASALGLAMTACEKPVVVSAGKPAVAGGMQFEVSDYDVQLLEIHKGDESFEYSSPVLVLPVKITNQDGKPFNYSPTHSAPQMNESSTPLLYVDPGAEAELPPAQKTTMKGVLLSKGKFPGQLNEIKAVNKGESLTDYYLFELPPEGTSGLVFSVPPTWHRGKLPALIRIPYTAKKPKGPATYAKGEAIDFEGVTLTIDSLENTYIKTSDTAQGEGFSTNPLLKISYTIENNRDEEIVYEPNHRAVAGAKGARLFFSDEGQPEAVKRIQFGPTTTPDKQLTGKTSIASGKKITDYVLFEQPGEGVTELNLEFPASLFDATGLARVNLDYAHSTPPLPKELEKKPAAPAKDGEKDTKEGDPKK